MSGTNETSVRSYTFFVDGTIGGTGSYADNQLDFVDADDGTPFVSHSVVFANDGATDLLFRFSEESVLLTHGPKLSPTKFIERETVTGGTSGATGVIKRINGRNLTVVSVTGTFQNGETITGNLSGAAANLSAAPVGPIPHGRVAAGETLQLDFRRARRVFLSGNVGLAYRVWAW